MISVQYSKNPDEIWAIDAYFDLYFDEKWMVNPLVKDMIEDIENSTLITPKIIDNTTFGTYPPNELSSGVKTLILILNEPKKIWNGSKMGDNCSKWLIEVGKQVDATICLHNLLIFPENLEFEIKFIDSGNIATNMDEFFFEYINVYYNIDRLTYKDLYK